MAVFWFAVLTDRAFLIDWKVPWDFTDFFESPHLDWKVKENLTKGASRFSFVDHSPSGIGALSSNTVVRLIIFFIEASDRLNPPPFSFCVGNNHECIQFEVGGVERRHLSR